MPSVALEAVLLSLDPALVAPSRIPCQYYIMALLTWVLTGLLRGPWPSVGDLVSGLKGFCDEVYDSGILCCNSGLLYGMVACCFGLLGFPSEMASDRALKRATTKAVVHFFPVLRWTFLVGDGIRFLNGSPFALHRLSPTGYPKKWPKG